MGYLSALWSTFISQFLVIGFPKYPLPFLAGMKPSGHKTWNAAMHRRSDQQMQKLDMLANISGFWKLQLPRPILHMMGKSKPGEDLG